MQADLNDASVVSSTCHETLLSSTQTGESRVLNQPIVNIRRISKSFQPGSAILDDVSFKVGRGEMVALIGASGSGKSTLIRSVAGLLPIAAGQESEISLFGKPMQKAGRISADAKSLRARTGVVFQQFNLVPRLSVLTNVCLGAMARLPILQGVCGQFSDAEKRAAMRALARVGMAEHALKRGSELSGGQQQRVAIARTLVQRAELILADEPIASLDPSSARRVMDLLRDLNRCDGITVVVSLHQVEYALRYCPRAIALKAGRLVYDGPSGALTPEFLTSIYGAESGDVFLPAGDQPHTPLSGQGQGQVPRLLADNALTVSAA